MIRPTQIVARARSGVRADKSRWTDTRVSGSCESAAPQGRDAMSRTASLAPPRPPLPWALLLPLPCLLWAFWPALTEMAHSWANNPSDSHGYLVPAFAAWLL